MCGITLKRSRKTRLIALILTSFLIVGIDRASAQQSPSADRWGASSVRPPVTSRYQQSQQDQSGQTADQKTDEVSVAEQVANYTFWLTILTGILAFSTTGLWYVGVTTARRQLRAYMSLQFGNVSIKGEQIIFELRFTNSGQTPAYDVYVVGDVAVAAKDEPLTPAPGPVSTPEKKVVGPDIPFNFIKALNVPKEYLPKITTDRTLWAYIFGRVHYRDAFKCKRYLDFTCRAARSVSGEWVVQPTRGGEKAN